ncbi:hypothetical protein [Stackebrandtia nassauensis]|uniref:hypothetical protein n=1 Tax=Stackebrandtia nassauensis TaxID=283811 RepID=UPI0001A39E3B|nr:hypothetical protein [Stackebrandtia nassauensis]
MRAGRVGVRHRPPVPVRAPHPRGDEPARRDQLIAVWDGQPARGYGGTADVVDYARDHGIDVTVIWPEGAKRGR